jgi:RimJ/RimL family protein N-acetyltransferase
MDAQLLVSPHPWLALELLAPIHDEGLRQIARLDDFQYWVATVPNSLAPDPWTRFLDEIRAMPNVVAFAVRDLTTGELVGSTTYMDIRPSARGLEIGMTWLTESARGTWINPLMKRMMLAHAFDQWSAIRVQLKTDARNLHSQAAIRKLGAVYEGTLRQHGIQRNGFRRDTALFSVIESEWPEVRARLDARLAGIGVPGFTGGP